MRKGFLLTRDVEIPLDDLDAGPQGEVRLAYTADQVGRLPEFEEFKYTTPPLEYTPPAGYPATGIYWPTSYAPPEPGDPGWAASSDTTPEFDARAQAAAVLTQQDIANAVIGEGSEVISRDGEKVGEVGHLAFDEATGRLTHFTVRQGFLATSDLELPVSLIASLADGFIYLNVDAAAIEQLGQAEPGTGRVDER